MKISVISGSHRNESQSGRITDYITERVKSLLKANCFQFKLAGNPLPLWDEGVWQDDPKWKNVWSPLAKEFQSSDGFVFVVPEWHGMVPSGVKNLFLLASNKEFGHKPGLIITVSASQNGAYPVSELRSSSTKNNRLVYIPDHVILRDAENIFKGSKPESDSDKYLRERTDYSLKILREYCVAMKPIRESGVVDFDKYGNGM